MKLRHIVMTLMFYGVCAQGCSAAVIMPVEMADKSACFKWQQSPVKPESPASTKTESKNDEPKLINRTESSDDPRERLPELPAREVMKYARLLCLKVESSWYNNDKLERELLKRKEFGDMGLELTREEKYADLILEITRKKLTTRFTAAMIEPRSKRVVGAATASSLGGEVEPNLAEAIIKEFKTARASAVAK